MSDPYAVGLPLFVLICAGAALFVLRRHYLSRLLRAEGGMKDLQSRLEKEQRLSLHYQNELNAILSSMVEGVIVVRKDEQILYVSPNVSQMLEMRSREVASKPYWEVIRHPEINACLKEALVAGRAVNKEISLIGPQDAFFSMQISPVRQDGALTSVVAVFHDITELRKLVKLRSEFVANVSHELKTPLTSIKGFVETLREGGLEDAVNARRFLDIIGEQTAHLEQLVKDLLELSAIESKEARMDIRPAEIAPVIDHALMMNKSAISSAGHQVDVRIDPAAARVPMDSRRMEQVFINLIDNAVKFTPKGGRISVIVRHEPPFVRIDVTDTGIGIAPEHLSRVFERFYRVDRARSRALGGTGLGLSIVKHIVSAHQGRVEIASVPDKGSTFSVFLPSIK